MNSKFSFTKITPYAPKLWSAIVYFILVGIAAFLFAGRKIDALKLPIILNSIPDFYSHVSNFSISFMLSLMAGYTHTMVTKNLKRAIVIALILITANVVYEWYLPYLNTPDKVDGYYGILGTILPFVFLVFYQKYGLKENPKYKYRNT
jgi:hypothetical protein